MKQKLADTQTEQAYSQLHRHTMECNKTTNKIIQ